MGFYSGLSYVKNILDGDYSWCVLERFDFFVDQIIRKFSCQEVDQVDGLICVVVVGVYIKIVEYVVGDSLVDVLMYEIEGGKYDLYLEYDVLVKLCVMKSNYELVIFLCC